MLVSEIKAGGAGNVGCIEKDIRNFQTIDREEKKEIDAQLLIDHFDKMIEMNDLYLLAMKLMMMVD